MVLYTDVFVVGCPLFSFPVLALSPCFFLAALSFPLCHIRCSRHNWPFVPFKVLSKNRFFTEIRGPLFPKSRADPLFLQTPPPSRSRSWSPPHRPAPIVSVRRDTLKLHRAGLPGCPRLQCTQASVGAQRLTTKFVPARTFSSFFPLPPIVPRN